MDSSFTIVEYLDHLHKALQATSKVLVVDVRKQGQIEYIYTAQKDTDAVIGGKGDTLIHTKDIIANIDECDNGIETDEASHVIDYCNQDEARHRCQDITSEDISKIIVDIEETLVDIEQVNGPTNACQEITSVDISKLLVDIEGTLVDIEQVNGPTIPLN